MTTQRPESTGSDATWLFFLIILVYAPLMVELPLPTTGDQKTYMAQAMEMAAAGSWFKQTLFGLPNYYKGPMLFWFLRLGFGLFGITAPAALIYANVLGYLAAAWAVLRLMRAYLPTDLAAAMLAAGATVLSSGAFAHGLSAQMEALLVAIYALFMTALGLAERGAEGATLRRLAWVAAGAAGLLKSPLHSALLGVSALLYWLATGQLRALLRRPAEWLSLAMGVATCAVPYLVPLVTDFDAFYATYIEREHLTRGVNQNTLGGALGPFVGGQLQPFVLLLLVATVAVVWPGKRRDKAPQQPRDLWILVGAMILPTGIFFAVHFFHSDIYFLPLLAPIAVATALLVTRAAIERPRILAVGKTLVAAVLLLVAALVALVVQRFHPFPAWWGDYRTALIMIALVLAAAAFMVSLRLNEKLKYVYMLLAGVSLLYGAVGQLLVGLENHERASFMAAASEFHDRSWARLNLTENLWADQALLAVLLQRPVGVVNNRDDLRRALSSGSVLFVLDDAQLTAAREEAAQAQLGDLIVRPYHTWRVHGRAANGEPAWAVAWKERSISPLEQTEYMVVASR